MNIKLHTPKTLKSGSGMSTTRQFFMALLATTISIILTFGTAAVIDHFKNKAAKKEMVMMLISDFDKTIDVLEHADTALRNMMGVQQELAIHPERFDSLRFIFPSTLNWIQEEFSETTESIFSTSIETFNTIGDVNFVNEVSSFYMARRKYKEMVLDKLKEELEREPIVQSLESVMNVGFPDYAYVNWVFLLDLKDYRSRCMQMMKVSEEDLGKFNKQQKVKYINPEKEALVMQFIEECARCNAVIEQTREKNKK